MTDTDRDTTDLLARVRVIQDATSDDDMVLPARPEATADEIRAGTSGCVNHLCGCR